MFGTLTEKFKDLISSLSGKKTLTESNIADACKQVRLALLDADVNYTVVNEFIKKVKEKALGDAVFKSVSPGDLFIKLVHDELIDLMGSTESALVLQSQLNTILLCGLQGSGKTTTAAKLAFFLQKKQFNKKVLIAACDLQRPAAIEQLKQFCAPFQIPVFSLNGATNPIEVVKEAISEAKQGGYDVLIVDTAGRLHIDSNLMQELRHIQDLLKPQETLFVANSTTGQDAVKVAVEFNNQLTLTGTILTMLDGTSRAGAAISISQMTQKPLKFEGYGEKIGDLQVFHPRSMADRVLGMGDIVNLVERAKNEIDEKEAEKLKDKLIKAAFTYDDYLNQMKMIKRMGPLNSLLKMIPGISDFPDLNQSEKELTKIEAMILSMTPEERFEQVELIPSRRNRISKGSGIPIESVNRMIKNFKSMKMICKNLPKKSFQNLDVFKKMKNFFG